LTDLQRAEALSLEKFLHLPVSLSGVFILNYVSSLLSLSLIVFVPMMVGLALGLVFSRGPAMLLLFPLLAGFFLMVTALTYQFRGWLASLMANKRRRQTIIVFITAAFILLAQLPNLVTFFHSGRGKVHLQSPEQVQQASREAEETVRLLNLVLPPGWLPLGALRAAENSVLPALWGSLGMSLIGAVSLWRAYRTTLRLYTGHYTAGKKRAERASVQRASAGAQSAEHEESTHATALPPPARSTRSALLERRPPWLSEQAAAIALAGFRSLTRAPEAKMMLLTPIIMVVLFGSLFLRGSMDPSPPLRALMAFGAMAMIMLSMVQLVGNQFGFDRGGFRVYVLCPASRRDILLGKNLAILPLALVLSFLMVAIVELVYPLPFDYLLAVAPQFLSMFLLFCLMANLLAILTPMAIAPGSFKPTNTRMLPILLQFVFLFLFPLTLAPTLLPLGLELLLEWPGVPVSLILSLLECTAVIFLYRLLVHWQGSLLQAREKKILQVVAAKAE
jgi:ABC-2 type transport system permease protein